MKIPLWLIALLFVGYSIWAANFWHNYQVRHCCGDAAAVTETSGAPLFRWNTEKPESDANFPDWKKALLAKGGQGDTLVITGWYRAGETDGEKLALARAASIRDLLAPELPAGRVRQGPRSPAWHGSAELENRRGLSYRLGDSLAAAQALPERRRSDLLASMIEGDASTRRPHSRACGTKASQPSLIEGNGSCTGRDKRGRDAR